MKRPPAPRRTLAMIVPTLAVGKFMGIGKVWKAGALVAVGAAGGGAALAVASVPDGGGVIHACVVMGGTVPASGPNLRIIDSDAGEQCITTASTAGEPTERPLDWNATGPPGAPGSAGTPGAVGPPGPAGKNATVAGGNTFTISGGQVITVGSGNGVTVASPPVNARGAAIGQASLAGHPSLTFGVLSVSLAGAAIGSGGGAGKVAVHEITISKKVDAASPKLSLACVRGTRYASATIALRKAGGDKQILVYRLSGVQISSYQIGGALGGGRFSTACRSATAPSRFSPPRRSRQASAPARSARRTTAPDTNVAPGPPARPVREEITMSTVETSIAEERAGAGRLLPMI